jgi:hypothetical protein
MGETVVLQIGNRDVQQPVRLATDEERAAFNGDSLEDAPRGYKDFEKGAAKKVVIYPDGMIAKGNRLDFRLYASALVARDRLD